MMATADLTVSVTEFQQYRRLVQFLADVEEISDDRCDEQLQDLVDACHDDLIQAGA